MGGNFFSNYIFISAFVLFAIGFTMLVFQRNLIKKIIGLDIMDSGVYLFLTSMGYIRGKLSAIGMDLASDVEAYANPIPAGLVLTGIVVSVSVSAIMLALAVRLYRKYRTLDVDKIYMYEKKSHDLTK